MTNLFKRFFTHKSKFLLIILCLLGLAFSYSCSCRNESTGPKWEDDDKKDGNTLTGGVDNDKGGKTYTPGATLSRNSIIVKSDASDTSYPINVTVTNADLDYSSWTISGGSLTKADFDFANGVLKVKQEKLASVKDTKETYNLTLKFITNSLFGENDTLSKETEEKTFELIKAQKKTLTEVKDILNKDIETYALNDVSFKFFNASVDGNGFLVRTAGTEVDGDYATKKIGKKVFGSDKLLNLLKRG